MQDNPLIIVLDSTEKFAEDIEAALSSTGLYLDYISVKDIAEADNILHKKRPAVLIIGPNIRQDEALQSASLFTSTHPFAAVIIAVERLNTEILRQSLKVGVRDVLEVPVKFEVLLESISSAVSYSKSIIDMALTGSDESESGTRKKGKVFTVFNIKGGVGKTVIATNLGVVFALRGYETFISDFDLQSGDVGVMLNFEPDRGIYEAAQSSKKLDLEMLEALVKKHQSGLKALLAPVDPALAESVTAARAVEVINFLKENADVVVIDTPAFLNDLVKNVLEISDAILLTATMDLPSLKSSKVAFGMLKLMNIDKNRIKLILNRADSKVGLTVNDVEKAIGTRVYCKIPSDRVIPRSVNMGIPAVLSHPKSDVGRSFDFLAERLTADYFQN